MREVPGIEIGYRNRDVSFTCQFTYEAIRRLSLKDMIGWHDFFPLCLYFCFFLYVEVVALLV